MTSAPPSPGGAPGAARLALLAAVAILAFGAGAMLVIQVVTRSHVGGASTIYEAGAAGRRGAAEVARGTSGATEAAPPALAAPTPPGDGSSRRSAYVDPPPPLEHDERVDSVASLSDHDDRLEALVSVRERRLARSMEALNRRAAAAPPARR